MDNVPYYSVKVDRIPVTSWKKGDIIQWIQDKNIEIKSELLDLINQYKLAYDKYVVNETAKAANKTVLRLSSRAKPNRNGMVKSCIKVYNTTFNLNVIKNVLIDGIAKVTPKN